MTQYKRKSLARAVSVALAGSAFAAVIVAPAEAQEEGALEEIIVTAQKRTQSLQDVPVSVLVLGNQQLEDLNLNEFGDYIQFLPTVSFQSERPGVSQVYIRGISSGGDGVHSGSMPSVGVYLDEQPITTINHILDMHVYDIARIETLAGPQGTFFGASSQSGTIRIITNKPEIGEFQSGFDVGVNSVEHGDIGYTLEGFANIPISDNAAIRLVGWHKEVAGYIDNVQGTITMPGNPQFVRDNSALVEKDFNDATISGMRASLKVDLNENWTVTPSLVYQQQESNGVWDHDPEDVGDLQTMRFFPEFYDDAWHQAALTLEGDVGDMNLVYAYSYLKRDADSQSDYIGYSQYWQTYYSYYYDGCYHYDSTDTLCTDSSQFVTGDEEFTRQSHELRLQSSQDSRFRWMAGIFYQRQRHYFDLRWNVPGMDPLGSSIWPDTPSSAVENDLVVWQTNQDRIDRDAAFFGEVEFDITDDLTVVGGYRYYDFENSLFGFNGFSGRCAIGGVPQYPCITGNPNLDDVSDGDGDTLKLSVNYSVADGKMFYVTYSEGFRAGGVNRARLAGQEVPKYEPDFVDNYEFGWKTSWLDGRMRLNGAAYLLEWDNFQFSFLDQSISPLTIIQNIGQAETVGAEFDLAYAATDRLTLTLAGSYNDAELQEPFWTDDDDRIAGDPPTAAAGAEMPFVPKIQATATGRLDVNYGNLPGYVQAAVAYTDDSWSLLNDALRQVQPSYTIVNLATGVGGENWTIDLFLDNVTDERSQHTRYHRDYADPLGVLFHDSTIGTNRPRTIGLRYGHRF
jgi:outer membrane receptor protein involved in Fe transport